MTSPPSSDARTSTPARVLVVDDDEPVAIATARRAARLGFEATTASSVEEALRIIVGGDLDVVVSDIEMPGLDGIDLLTALRERDLGLPVIFLTGAPTVRSATRAVEHGAFRYLTKPIDGAELQRALEDAVRARALARARDPMGQRQALEARFRSALAGMWMAAQPIVAVESHGTYGFEILLRSREPALPHPGAVIDAAEKLGAVHALGRHARALTAEVIAGAPEPATFFVNVHPADLADADLYDRGAPLTRHARRIVIEITERSTLEGVGDLDQRVWELRALGYRLAVDDLGAGYAGLSYFATLQPDVVKIDMSLVRGIDADPVKQRVVASMASLCRSLGIDVVGEGVETPAERDALCRLGCTHLQGFLFARPAAPFPTAEWGPP